MLRSLLSRLPFVGPGSLPLGCLSNAEIDAL
jgi:hypothetical protein